MHFPPRFLTGAAVLVVLTFVYIVSSISARDPTSIFFNPRKGYAPRYSAVRRQVAQAYVASYNPAAVVKAGDEKTRKLCVGIPSYNRPQAEHLQSAVGSLLHGLTPEERQEIYLIVFLPHSKPERHPAYGEKWLAELTDNILTYNYGFDRMQHIRNMEAQDRVEEKSLFDYSYLLDKCTEQLTPYIAIFEDDTIAADGWYHRTMDAIHEAERQAALHRSKPGFLYLRLFYTEDFLGWNAENWKTYLNNSIWITTIFTIALFGMRIAKPTMKLSFTLSSRRTLVITYTALACLILLFFGLGRLTVLPMPTGVHEMQQFGCCSQAFVFPRIKAVELIAYFKERHLGYVDVLTEDFANERGELRYAVTPSLVQHVGRENSRGDPNGPMSKWGMSVAERIWSFTFEDFNAASLHQEHQQVAQLRHNKRREQSA